MRPLHLIALALLATPAAAQDRPELTVYAPDYFATEWGPGPKIEAGFEATCACDLAFVTGDVLPRILGPRGVMVVIQYSPLMLGEFRRRFRSVRWRITPWNVPPAFLFACSQDDADGSSPA